MDKYIIISDISKCPCYSNINARILYLHIACNVDTSTYNYCQSYRRLALETGLSVDAVRHAVRLLERDGLVTTHVAPHRATQYAPQATPQRTTHLHIVTIKDLSNPNGNPNTTPNTTANTTDHTTDHTTQLKKLKKLTYTHTHACDMREVLKGDLERVLKISSEEAEAYLLDFLERQELKGKEWSSEDDIRAHLVSFAEKRLPRKRVRKIDEVKARSEEYQRAQEQASLATPEEKRAEEVERLKRWLAEAERKGEKDRAKMFRSELKKLNAK